MHLHGTSTQAVCLRLQSITLRSIKIPRNTTATRRTPSSFLLASDLTVLHAKGSDRAHWTFPSSECSVLIPSAANLSDAYCRLLRQRYDPRSNRRGYLY